MNDRRETIARIQAAALAEFAKVFAPAGLAHRAPINGLQAKRLDLYGSECSRHLGRCQRVAWHARSG